ncbi:MAG: DUF1018 domain-containing protein [Magnetococcales bacterium]|nr:DUF1018 domain-containing protein [Magnetococcales bacterium]
MPRQSGEKKSGQHHREMARIHALQSEAGILDPEYREILWDRYSVLSSRSLSTTQRADFVLYLQARAGGRQPFPGRPEQHFFEREDIGPSLGKVEALLADAKRPWNYAHAIAKRLAKVDRVEWCDGRGIHKVVSAMQKDANRRKAREG